MPPKKRPIRTSPVPTADKVAASVRKGEYAAAVDQARLLNEAIPSESHAALYADTLLRAAEHHEKVGRWELLPTLLVSILNVNSTDPGTKKRLAVLLAKCGRRTDADALATDANTAAHFADYLIRTRSEAAVPPEWKAGYDAVHSAFRHYSAGQDEPAREALNAVGLGSPFLEWKLLLRGLMAWTAKDDTKAVENFSRLNAERFPARLAAPVRAGCDKSFAPDDRPTLTAQARTLRSVGLMGKLAKVQFEMARGRQLAPAFKAAEAAVTELKKSAPQLLPKLADCFYYAIIRRGEQPDLARHRKLFGPQPSDPQFFRLEALVFEELQQEGLAVERWGAFERWLADARSGWPKPLADRARAIILCRCAELAEDLELAEADDLDFFFAPRTGKGKAKQTPPPDPVAFLKRATELAPDWEIAATELFEVAMDHDDPATAEAAARTYLKHNPKSLGMLTSLATALISQGHTAEALELRRRALAINPLDTSKRNAAGSSTIAHARRLGMTKPADAEKLLAEAEQLLEATVPTSLHALRSVLYRKLKRPDDADRAAERAAAVPNSRLVARLYLHANAVILKLKPAEKKAAADALTAALLERPTPGEGVSLMAGFKMYFAEGQTYIGQKTQEKKLLDVLSRAVESPTGTEYEFEMMAALFVDGKNHLAAGRAAASLMKRFPKNPLFPLVAAQTEYARSKGRSGYRVLEPLRKARALAEASTEERHKLLIPQIDDMLKVANPLAGMFGSFFG